jgi:hypothetical protein
LPERLGELKGFVPLQHLRLDRRRFVAKRASDAFIFPFAGMFVCQFQRA